MVLLLPYMRFFACCILQCENGRINKAKKLFKFNTFRRKREGERERDGDRER